MAIEIQPDGSPKVVPDKPKPEDQKKATSDFVAQVMESRSESLNEIPDETPVDKLPAALPSAEIPPTGPGNPAPQHAHLIKAAKEFNESLHSSREGRPPATFGIPYPIQMNIGIEAQIRAVLKDGGMDTQQQDKSMNRIAEILSTAKQRENQ